MHSTQESRRLPRFAGGALGACIAVATIVLALPSGGRGGVLPATLDVAVRPTATLAVSPAAPSDLLHAADLRPGSGGRGAGFDLENETGQTVAVGLRASASSPALDGIVRLRVRSGRHTVADSTLGQLRDGSSSTVSIPKGGRRSLRATAWIPSEVETGYEGQRVRVELVPSPRSGAGR